MTCDKLSSAICLAFDPFALFPPDIPVWVVGGAVRDLILKKDPHDWDLVVDLDINGIKDLTGGSVVGPKGKQVCVFSHSHRVLEVASMVGGSITADLARRDFTVNAMALGRGWSIVDPFCGEEDLLHRRLRFVPELEDRLTEDPVRAIRFCRFSATLGLTPMEDQIKRLKAFVRENRKNLNSIHPQRIGREMIKGLVLPKAFLWLLSDVGLVEMFLPEFKSNRVKDLPEGPLSLALSIGLLSFAQSRCDWHSLLISWGVPSSVKKEALLLGSVLSSLSLPLGMDGICDLILNFGTSWSRDLQGLVELGYADNDIFRDNLRQIDLALLRLSDAERAGIPLTGGDVAAEIGAGPHVRVCLDRLMRYALSEEKPSLERAMDIISIYR